MAKKEGTKSIVLNIPEPLYDEISDEATADSRKNKKKKSIADKMLEKIIKGHGKN